MVRLGSADGPRGSCSSGVLRVLARLSFRSVAILCFGWTEFRTVRSSGRTVRGCLADSPCAPRGWSVVRGVPLMVLFALTDGPRLRPDSPRQGCGQSAVPGRTVRAAHHGRSALSGRTVRQRLCALLLGSIPPFLLSCFCVCFKESFLRLEVDP
jgi:hypothetical protein